MFLFRSDWRNADQDARRSAGARAVHCLSEAVKLVRGARKVMTIAEREAITDDAARRVASKPGDPWRLKEELPPPSSAIGHGSPEGWSKGRE